MVLEWLPPIVTQDKHAEHQQPAESLGSIAAIRRIADVRTLEELDECARAARAAECVVQRSEHEQMHGLGPMDENDETEACDCIVCYTRPVRAQAPAHQRTGGGVNHCDHHEQRHPFTEGAPLMVSNVDLQVWLECSEE